MTSDQTKDLFQEQTDAFLTWIEQQQGTTINPKIRIDDLREHGQGRGVGELSTCLR